MKTSRVVAVFSIIAAACTSNVERAAAPAPSAEAAHAAIEALHAAIPASRMSGEVFEYSTAVAVAVTEKVATFHPGGQVFEYN